MNYNIEKMNESIKDPSQRRNNEKNERADVGRDIKNRTDEAITKSNVDGDPTRSDE
ncbi:MAG TPA: hypothetical protein VHF44_02905 [Nitrososphaeraceae archaeon]|nr:hypothetical protein [Nitrososphaeraceae archaeon]